MTAREIEIIYAKAFCEDAERILRLLKKQYERAEWLYRNCEWDELYGFEKLAEAYMCISESCEPLRNYYKLNEPQSEESEEREDYN